MKVEGVGELDFVGPTGVAVADPEVVEPPTPPAPPAPLVVDVPLDGGAEDPVPMEWTEESVLEGMVMVERVLEGQYVVVYVVV